jgi:hypothetical protein
MLKLKILDVCRCEDREEGEEEFLTVIVSDPHKVGEGMSSYMAYKVSTRYTEIKPMSVFGRKIFLKSKKLLTFSLPQNFCDVFRQTLVKTVFFFLEIPRTVQDLADMQSKVCWKF